MTVALRPFQTDLESKVYAAWGRSPKPSNVMMVSATGSGKTTVFSKIMKDNRGGSVAIAHRQEIVSQISLSLARNGVQHRIIGSDNLARSCRQLHLAELGREYTHPNARSAAASVDTLIRLSEHDPIFARSTLVVPDEAHHVLKVNKWGKAMARFTAAYGLLPTATPDRADGAGLGRDADGVVDEMVEAPSMRSIINMGYLTGYRIFAPPSDLDLSSVPVGADGDFSQPKLREATHLSHIVGDVVGHYLKLARGKLGVTFAVDVESAIEIAAAFRAQGVPAEVVSAKTPDLLRSQILRRFKNREVLQLVNVDLFGEGFDLPAIEVVSMARATQSFALYSQQFGRALRLMLDPKYFENGFYDRCTDAERRAIIACSMKPEAIILDHVSNVIRHNGPPDRRVLWSLARRDIRARETPDDAIQYRVCANQYDPRTGIACNQPYESYLVKCPHCGFKPVPRGRSTPEQVDGNLEELDTETLDAMFGEIQRIDDAPNISPYGAANVAGAIKRTHWERQQAQAALRHAMQWYGGLHTAHGQPVNEAWKRFYLTFGVDVGTAQTLGAREAETLRLKIVANLAKSGIDATVNAN